MNRKQKIYLIITVIFVLILRIDTERVFLDLGIDKFGHLLSSENYKENKSFHIPYVTYENLGNNNHSTFIGYARGYNLLLSLIPLRAIYASLLVDILSIIILILVFLYFFHLFKISFKTQLLFLIFTGFTYTPYIYLPSTDLLVVVFIFMAIAFTLFLKSINNFNYFAFLIIGIAGYIPLFFKYSAYPLILVFPLLFLTMGIIEKNKKFLIGSFITLLTSVIGMKLMDNFLQNNTNEWLFEKNGMFFHQLSQIDDFPFESFVFAEHIIQKIDTLYNGFYFYAHIVTFVVSIVIIVLIGKHYFKDFRVYLQTKNSTPFLFFYTFGIFTFLGILSYLSLLTIIIPGIKEGYDPYWTFVTATRYYAPAMIFIQLIVFIIVFENKIKNRITDKTMKLFLYFAIVFAIIYWTNQNYKYYIKDNKQYTFKKEYEDPIYISKVIDSWTFHNRTVYVDNNPYHARAVKLLSNIDAVCSDYYTIIEFGIHSTATVDIIMKFSKTKSPEEIVFLQEYPFHKKFSHENFDLYHLIFIPNGK